MGGRRLGRAWEKVGLGVSGRAQDTGLLSRWGGVCAPRGGRGAGVLCDSRLGHWLLDFGVGMLLKRANVSNTRHTELFIILRSFGFFFNRERFIDNQELTKP